MELIVKSGSRFITCIRKEDGVVGIYDVVNKCFCPFVGENCVFWYPGYDPDIE